jgi:signal peptidase II
MRDNGAVIPSDGAETAAVHPTPQQPPPAQRPRRMVLFAIVAALALALDVVSKVVVVATLGGDHAPVRALGGAIYLDIARNSGAAFSLAAGTGFTIVLTAIAVVVVVVLLRSASRMRSIGWAVSLGLVLGGALGNLTDRIFRYPGVGRGYVVDWISLFGPDGKHWPIFNLADSAITSGAVLAAVVALLGIQLDGTRQSRASRG